MSGLNVKEVGLMADFEVLDFIEKERAAEEAKRGKAASAQKRGKTKKVRREAHDAVNSVLEDLDLRVLEHLRSKPAAHQSVGNARRILKAVKESGINMSDEDRLQVLNLVPTTEVHIELLMGEKGASEEVLEELRQNIADAGDA